MRPPHRGSCLTRASYRRAVEIRLRPRFSLGIAATALSACAPSLRPSPLTPATVAGCYLVSVAGPAEVTGVFPDTIGLDSVPAFDTAGFLGTAYMVSQIGRIQSLYWRLTGSDSLEIVASVLFKAIDVRARLKTDGFAGTATFTDATHSTTASVTATRSYCVGFGIKSDAK